MFEENPHKTGQLFTVASIHFDGGRCKMCVFSFLHGQTWLRVGAGEGGGGGGFSPIMRGGGTGLFSEDCMMSRGGGSLQRSGEGEGGVHWESNCFTSVLETAVKAVRLQVYMTIDRPMTSIFIQGHQDVSNLITF